MGLATAAVDHLLKHAHVIFTDGRSHRLTDAIDGRGVAPLAWTTGEPSLPGNATLPAIES